MRCCMCGKRRLFGRAYEMYGEDGGWWHACPECATSELAGQLEVVLSGDGVAKRQELPLEDSGIKREPTS